MLLFPESGPKKIFWVNGITKTVDPHLRSMVPNVQRHMAYLARLLSRRTRESFRLLASLASCTWPIMLARLLSSLRPKASVRLRLPLAVG